MTVAVETPFASYNTDGSTLSFPVPFSFTQGSDVYATLTVAGVSAPAGGSLVGLSGSANWVFTTAPATGGVLEIQRATPISQIEAFGAGSAFPDETLEFGLDRLTRQLAEVSFLAADTRARLLTGLGTNVPVPFSADLVNFSGKTIAPGHVGLTNNIVVSGAASPANSHLFISATMSGTTGDFNPASVLVNVAETITQPTAYGTIAGITVNHAIGSGAGKGSRAGIYAVVTGNGPIADGGAAYSYRTGILGIAICNADEGGGSGSPLGNYYGAAGVATILGNAHVQGAIGAEFDTSVAAGSTATENMIVQAVLINSHAVKGTSVDAGFLCVADSTTTAKLNYGLAFGKPGSKWPVDGTLIGAYACTDGQAAQYGVDLSNVTFTQAPFKSNGFSVTNSGAIFALSVNISNETMFSTSAPPAPPAGQFYLYMDAADNKYKAKGPSGTVTILANP